MIKHTNFEYTKIYSKYTLLHIFICMLILSAFTKADPLTKLLTGESSTQVSTASKTINKNTSVQDDRKISNRLRSIYSKIDGMEKISVAVHSGVVELAGEVNSMTIASRAVELAGQVQSVVDVQNTLSVNRDLKVRLTSTWQKLLSNMQQTVANLPLFLVALLVIIVFWILGGYISRREKLFRRITPNQFIATLLGQITHLIFIIIGIILALSILDATALLGTILGAASIIGLAVGFAVRDTIENFIASIMLSLRKPFEVNDYIDINGQLGNVVKLTSRATILLSLDGNHIRIPNSIVFKSVIINYTRNPERRFVFDVGVDTQLNLVTTSNLAKETIESVTGVLVDPAVMVLVDSLGDSNVVLRCYGWVDQNKYSFFKVRSESIRLVKQAFDQAGIIMPEPIYAMRMINDSEDKQSKEDDKIMMKTTSMETGDVKVDKTIENKISDDASIDDSDNLLSDDAASEI